jgi:peptidoglycan-associated lipoprotein
MIQMLAPKPWMVGAVLVASLGVTGCATHKYVDQHVGAVDTKINGTQSQVEAHQGQLAAHDAKLGELDRTSREALDRAMAAGKLAEGKFMYSIVLQDDGVKFKSAKYKLSDADQAKLTELAGKLKADNKNVYLEIQGHTDSMGPPPYNMELGEERAEAVRVFLNQQGIALSRMSTISYGETAPIAPNKTRAGRAQNRRVQIVVLA